MGEVALHISSDGPPLRMSFDPELPLGARVRNARIGEREIAATPTQHPQDAHARVEFDVTRGDTSVRISYDGGVAIVPAAAHPAVGESSRGMKIIGVSLEDRAYTIQLDHRAAQPARVELRTPWKIHDVQGAKLTALAAPAAYELEIAASADPESRAYKRDTVVVSFESIE
jgi:hypothetical protein